MAQLQYSKDIPPGFYEHLSNEDYHASQGFSRSQLKEYDALPERFYSKYISKTIKDVGSKALDFGNAFHVAVQEPHLFDSQFAIAERFDRRTKLGKEALAQFETDNAGKTVLTPEDFEQIMSMKAQILKDNFANQILKNTKTKFESSIYWKHKDTGLTLKCRPDMLSNGVIADLKTTQDASPRAFQRSCVKYDYYLQAGMMKLGMESIGEKLEAFFFICCEKTAPHSTACYILTEEAINYGAEKCERIIKSLSNSLKNNIWPGYGMQELGLPEYLKTE